MSGSDVVVRMYRIGFGDCSGRILAAYTDPYNRG